MTSIIKLQTFSGAYDDSLCLAYLLQVDEFHFLLDCGWREDLNMKHINELKKYIGQIDAVLLTYPDLYHLGSLPYLVGKCGLSCPIYATVPVYKMGQMFMYDFFQSHHNTEDFDLFTLDDVDAAFDKIIQLKYSQTMSLRGKGHGLQITPIPGGHMIGGTIWKIVKEGEEEIVYAVDYNHKKERHLNGCMLETIGRPHVLITDAFNAKYVQARRRARDEQLMTNILTTMRNDGNVMIAVDTAGRVLELAHLLDQMWRTAESGLSVYSLALLNNVSYNVVEFAKSQVEWMSDKIMKSFEDKRNNPFQFRHVQLCHSLAELNRVPEPKVVLASVPDLQCGFSKELFLQWCSNTKNSIILTSRSSPGTLTRNLIDNPSKKKVDIQVNHRVKLSGDELEEYLQRKHEKKEKERLAAKLREREQEQESSDESETEMEEEIGYSGEAKHDLMVQGQDRSKQGFFKQTKKTYPMFPFVEEKIRCDEYGEYIKHEDFRFDDVGEEEKMETETETETEKPNKKEEEKTEIPTRCVSVTKTFDILAHVHFIDFEGRSDGESIRKILGNIRPRELILVHGNPESTEALASYCRSQAGMIQGAVHTPKVNEIVDVTKESHIYQVKLRDSVVSRVPFTKTHGMEMGWIDAMVDFIKFKPDTFDEQKDKNKNQAAEEDAGSEPELVPTLVPLPSSQIPPHSAVFINEPRLSDFKQILINEGITAEFSAGILLCCGGNIALRKNEAGRIQLEGVLSEDYYKVRDLLYGQYAIV